MQHLLLLLLTSLPPMLLLASDSLVISDLFVADIKLARLLRDLEEAAPSELLWYLESHEFALNEFRAAGVDLDDPILLSRVVEERLASNVLHIYLLLKRTVTYLDAILAFFEERKSSNLVSLLWYNRYNDYSSQVSSIKSSLPWPTQSHLEDSLLSVSRIQYVYQLSTADLADGILGAKATEARLGITDCLEIAKSREKGHLEPTSTEPEYALAIEWAETALQLSVAAYGMEDSFTMEIISYISDLKEQHDLHFRRSTPGNGPSFYPNEAFFISKIGSAAAVSGRELRLREYEEFSQRFGGEYDDHYYSRRDFFALCRGEQVKFHNMEMEKPHQCRFETRMDPYLLLQPIKLEVLQLKPIEIYVLHDAVAEKQIDYMKATATLTISRAEVFNQSNPSTSVLSTDRTQSTAWLFDKKHPELWELSKRLDHLTGLQVSFVRDPNTYEGFEESEDYQIGFYGPGGLYLAHYDDLEVEEIKWRDSKYLGDRIATLMIYLSDVESGGRTAFPKAGVAATPVKGAAVFWFNLRDDGSQNTFSVHGGCPVLYGSKWVSNKWIREGSQFLKKPCLP